MPEPISPGVYLDETAWRPRPIAPVNTATAAILGPVPGNTTPVVVESQRALQALVGPPTADGSFLPWAAEGFFTNGGRRLLILPCDLRSAAVDAALAHLVERTDVGMLLAPDTLNPSIVPPEGRREIEERLLAHVDARRDKLLLLGLPRSVARADDRAVAETPGSAFTACWHPWLTATGGGLVRAVPPTGHVAGVVARTDREAGTHRSPGNQPVRGLGDPPLAGAIAAPMQDLFAEAQVNIIRDFRADGRGVRLWQARTGSDDPEYRQLSVRRLMIGIEQSLARGLQWAAFEPNGERLWINLRVGAETFLQDLWEKGALLGARPETAYFTRCDTTTMTEADLAGGRAVLLVGVAPVKPAEFLMIRIVLATGDTNA